LSLWAAKIHNSVFLILLLSASGIGSAGECPLLVEPEEIFASTSVTANWTSVLVCRSEPIVEVSGAVVTVDFNFGYCPGVLPPGACGNHRASIGKLPPGSYTLVAIGRGTQRSVNFEVLPIAIPGLNATGKVAAVLLFLSLAMVRLAKRSRQLQLAGAPDWQ